MTIIVDASVAVAALVDSGAVGEWALQPLRGERLCALDAPLVTLDDRLVSAPGPECRFETQN